MAEHNTSFDGHPRASCYYTHEQEIYMQSEGLEIPMITVSPTLPKLIAIYPLVFAFSFSQELARWLKRLVAKSICQQVICDCVIEELKTE